MAFTLILLGIAPLAYLRWWESAHNLEPLVFPLPLQRGAYTSPSFQTDLDEGYQVDLYFLPSNRSPLDLDWKIVDEGGALIKSGSYREDQRTGGNDVVLDRNYWSKRGLRQKIMVSIHQDVQASDANTALHIGLPEEGLRRGYAIYAAMLWAAVLAGGGAIVLLVAAMSTYLLR